MIEDEDEIADFVVRGLREEEFFVERAADGIYGWQLLREAAWDVVLLDRLQDSFVRQQRFTGGASHQLRTPLAAMPGQVEVALRRERIVDEYQRVLSIVHDRSTHLKNIVKALLFLARADSDATMPGRQAIEMRGFLTNCAASFAEHERFTDLNCDFQDTAECVVSGHPTLLQELVTILLDNAFKFSPPGTPVTIRLLVDPNSAIVSIRDCGEGIESDDIEHLGEPFFRTERARKQGIQGIGLGLSIARRLSSTLGACMSFGSEVGNGTTVTLRLPRIQQESPA